MVDYSRSSLIQRWVVLAFFAAVLVMGLLIFRDYGLSIDENQQRDTGMISLKHVAQKLAPAWVASNHEFDWYQTPLSAYPDRDYGVAFETPVCFLERLLKIEDGGDKFLFRHLCTFLVCFGGLVAIYQLATRRFRGWRLGLLLSPRLFADFFYNDKDAVFMALFAVATNTGVLLLLRPTAGRALACTVTIDVRVMGVLLPLATISLLGWRAIRAEVGWPRVASIAALYLTVLAGLVVLFWPYLWAAPVQNFMEAFNNMSAFRWHGYVLYQGSMVEGINLPWHYSLVWMGVTTPILYLAAGVTGLAIVSVGIARQGWRLWRSDEDMQDLLFLGLFSSPLLAVIVLHSVLYDGWRQLYFVYPSFILLALRGWVAAATWRPGWVSWPKALYGTTILSMVLTTAQMMRDHPLQNVYFNLLAGPRVAERFELDYWGVGYRQDLEYIIKTAPQPVVKVAVPPLSPGDFNRLMLPINERNRIRMVDNPDSADYFLTNYRWHPEPYPYDFEVYQLQADGRRIHSVFRLRW